MKKIVSLMIVFCIIAAVCVAQEANAQAVAGKKAWNDGTFDYVPAGTKVELTLEKQSEMPVSLYYSLDLGEISEYGGPIQLEDEGAHYLLYAPASYFGTVGGAKLFQVTVDATPPEFSYALEGDYYVDENGQFFFSQKTGVVLQGKDALSGLESIYVSADGSEPFKMIVEELFYMTDFEDGKHIFTLTLTDNVGNKSEEISLTAVADNTAPNVYVSYSPDPLTVNGVNYVAAKTACSITADDEISGVRGVYISIDGSAPFLYQQSFSLPVSGGSHTLTVYAVDNAGNRSEDLEFTYTAEGAAMPANHTVVIE